MISEDLPLEVSVPVASNARIANTAASVTGSIQPRKSYASENGNGVQWLWPPKRLTNHSTDPLNTQTGEGTSITQYALSFVSNTLLNRRSSVYDHDEILSNLHALLSCLFFRPGEIPLLGLLRFRYFVDPL